MNTNTYNTAAPAKAPLSTRIESHIPGTEAHRERKLAQAQVGNTGSMVPQAGATGFQANNVAGAPAMNTANTVPGNTTGYQNTAPTVAGTAPTTGAYSKHGTTMGERAAELQGRRPADTSVPRAHMGDKVMGTVEASIGRMTNNPAREEAGLERKAFGDPKHYAGGHGLHQQQGFGPTGQPAQQAYTQPQQAYTQPQQAFNQPQQTFNQPQQYPPTQPPTGY